MGLNGNAGGAGGSQSAPAGVKSSKISAFVHGGVSGDVSRWFL